MILRTRLLLPMDGPPVENAGLVIQGAHVLSVGRWPEVRRHASGDVIDLGESVILPGLVNAHAHLDYTRMAGRLPPPRDFTDWIQGILALKAEFGYSEYAESWIDGARMLSRHGTTTVLDIEAVPELLPEVWSAVPLRVISCLELTGVRSGRDPERIVGAALELMDRLPAGRCRTGLSPHAPYSTGPELLRLAAATSQGRGCLLTTHVAESQAEFAMFNEGTGSLYRWLARNGRNMNDCAQGSPVNLLARLGYLSERLLAVHVNYLGREDARSLAEHGTQVVHCPRSHSYFGHAPFPFDALRQAGVNVALGTDSLASVRTRGDPTRWSDEVEARQNKRGPGSCHYGHSRASGYGAGRIELDLFEEMRTFRAAHPAVAPELVLGMATRNGAAALGWSKFIGRLGPGAWSDLAILRIAPSLPAVYEAVLEHSGPVAGLMIAGQWVTLPGGMALEQVL